MGRGCEGGWCFHSSASTRRGTGRSPAGRRPAHAVRLISRPANGWGLFPLDRALIWGAQPIYGWWALDALHYINRSRGLQAHNTKFVVRRQTLLTSPRPSDRLAQWRREAPPRRLHSTPSPPSSISAGGGSKDEIYVIAASTLSPWTPPDPLSPETLMVETLTSLTFCFLVDLAYACITVYLCLYLLHHHIPDSIYC